MVERLRGEVIGEVALQTLDPRPSSRNMIAISGKMVVDVPGTAILGVAFDRHNPLAQKALFLMWVKRHSKSIVIVGVLLGCEDMGGLKYTIFENMRKKKADITMRDTEKMVQAYWDGVPIFKAFCEELQRIAREESD